MYCRLYDSFIHFRYLYSASSSGITQKRLQPQRGQIMLFQIAGGISGRILDVMCVIRYFTTIGLFWFFKEKARKTLNKPLILPVTKKNPSSSFFPMSPECIHPSSSKISFVNTGSFR